MINKVDEKQCTICGACMQICPKGCISFTKKYKSFNYPVINSQECIECNLCEKVCPALNILEKRTPISYFAAKNKDVKILQQSSSGGIFSSLAEFIILQKGYVCGAAFNNNFIVKHKIVSTIEGIPSLCGSKYVQSDLNECLKRIKMLIESGKNVLFVGCPCQSAALRSYVKDNPDNLFVVDFICHGSVSPDVFESYKSYLENKYNGRIVDFAFRNKGNGWLFSGLHVEFDNGQCYDKPLSKDVYMQGYFKNLNLKECCFNCAYKGYHSGSDITLGDFWGIQDIIPDFYDYFGNSVVIINTPKGGKLFERIKCKLEIREVSEEQVLIGNSGLVKPFSMSNERDEYFKKSKKYGYIKPLEKYIHSTILKKIYLKGIRIVHKMIKDYFYNRTNQLK